MRLLSFVFVGVLACGNTPGPTAWGGDSGASAADMSRGSSGSASGGTGQSAGLDGSGSSGGSGGVTAQGDSGGAGGFETGAPASSSGTTGSSASSSGSGSGGSGSVTGTAGPKIPQPSSSCPTLTTGNVTVMGQSVQIFAGSKRLDQQGAVFLYWHGTGGTSAEVQNFMSAQINEITNAGGLVASFTTTTKMGTNTGNSVWFTGDFAMADEIVACAVQQLNIDVRRIYTGGCSAGGLQAGAMVYARSGYLAAAMPNSGGIVSAPGLSTLSDPSHVPALVTTHGAPGTDVVVVDFSQTSLTEDKDIVAKGGFAVDCNHGGGHCQAPPAVIAGQWQFLKDHPFGVAPEPYAGGLPSSLPTYCAIIK